MVFFVASLLAVGIILLLLQIWLHDSTPAGILFLFSGFAAIVSILSVLGDKHSNKDKKTRMIFYAALTLGGLILVGLILSGVFLGVPEMVR